jgi:hypothetical protein
MYFVLLKSGRNLYINISDYLCTVCMMHVDKKRLNRLKRAKDKVYQTL